MIELCVIEGCSREADNEVALYDFGIDETIPAKVCDDHYELLIKRYYEKSKATPLPR